MGTVWEDEGQVKVVVVRPDVSIGRVQNSCEYVQRGEIILPFTERPVPPLKSEANFDKFAPPSGKTTAMVITGKKYQEQIGVNDIVLRQPGQPAGRKGGETIFRIFSLHRGPSTKRPTAQTPCAFRSMWTGTGDPSMDLEAFPRSTLGPTYLARISEKEWCCARHRTLPPFSSRLVHGRFMRVTMWNWNRRFIPVPVGMANNSPGRPAAIISRTDPANTLGRKPTSYSRFAMA